MFVLVLDPASSTGYCVVTIDSSIDEASIKEYGFIDIDTTSQYQGDHCLDLMKRIAILIEKFQIRHIVVEDFFFSSNFSSGSNVNVAYRTAIHILARQHKLDYTILNISSWKKHVSGRTTPTAQQKELWGKDAAKKLMIQQALWEKYKFRFPNHSFSEKTGKPILFRYDIVDVVAQAVYFVQVLQKISSVKLEVLVPPDVIHKGNIKKLFVYIPF